MDNERYVAAVEISSSKIICAVGRYDGRSQLRVEAVEQEDCKESVRYGIVQNLEETAIKLSRIIEKIQRKQAVAPRKISGLFVGLSGRSLRSISTDVKLMLPEETEIDDEILDRLRRNALQTAIDSSLEVVDAVPRNYFVDKNETSSPKGAIGKNISVTYDIIVCRPEIKRNLQRTIEDKTGIRIEGFVVTPLAAGHIVLSREEKHLGCMLVDMGAETTSVSIYTHGCLRYFATLPLGGRNITRDLTSLSLLEERAEEIKITSGNAIAPENPSQLNLNGIKLSDVSNYIVARAEEIVANIVQQIEYAGIKETDIPGGIVCIGGAARLTGITELLSRQSGLNVRMGNLPDYIHLQGLSTPPADMLEVDCVLYEGATLSDAECLEIPHTEELPHTGQSAEEEEARIQAEEEEARDRRDRRGNKMQKILNRFQTRISRIFVNPEEEESDLYDE